MGADLRDRLWDVGLTGLRRMTEALHGGGRLEEVFSVFSEVCGLLVSCRGHAVYVISPEGGELVLKRAEGMEPADLARLRGYIEEGVVAWVMHERTPRFIPKFDEAEGDRAYLMVPLWIGGKALGVLVLHQREDADALGPQVLQLITLLAIPLAMVLENESLAEGMAEKVRELQGLMRVASSFAGVLSLERLLALLTKAFAEMVPAEAHVFYGHDGQEGRLVPFEQIGAVAPAADAVSRWVWEHRRPLVISDYARDPRFHADAESPVRAVLSVPVMLDAQIVGVLSAYNRKHQEAFTNQDLRLTEALTQQGGVAAQAACLYESLQRSFLDTVVSLANALESKDAYTRGHSERVGAYAVAIARAMRLTPDELRLVEMAGRLHDIGKIGINDSILTSPCVLTPPQRQEIARHPGIGDRIAGDALFLGQGRAGIIGRIVAVADAWDAMTTDRPYRARIMPEHALRQLRVCAGTQFDRRIAEVAAEILPGSTRPDGAAPSPV
ncbi:MAG: GAF domain-containing protein [Deltaproteobacteria bacterium]|nr:GAF domain-containing protein [Deltaproteobacteria bacterium]